jgi:adenylate kinase family enzyme
MEVDLRRLQRQAAEGADRYLNLSGTRKVAVIGNTCSGKTTFSRALARRLGVPHVELDALFWKPGWQQSTAEEFKPRVVEALEPLDGWVVDGNYRTKLGDYVLGRADMIVWLDAPLQTTMSRVVRRTVRRLRTREGLWGTNVETVRGSFFRRDSLLWWALRKHRDWQRRVPDVLAPYPHVRLRSPREVAAYLEKL